MAASLRAAVAATAAVAAASRWPRWPASCEGSFAALPAEAARVAEGRSSGIQKSQMHAAGVLPGRTAVLVRTYFPSDAAIERIRCWAADLQKETAAVDFWISVDTTWAHVGAKDKIEAALAQWPHKFRESVRP